MSALLSIFGNMNSGALMGKGGASGVAGNVAQAREAIANLFPAQSTVGRAMRAFNSAGNPISGVINMFGSLFGSRKYRSDQYRAGEKYMLYVLGIDIHKWHDVDDAVVPEALQFFSSLLGVQIESWTGIEELRGDIALFKKNRKPSESDAQIQAAQKILQSLPWNDVAGAWINPLTTMAQQTAESGSIIGDVKNLAGGLGKNSTLLLIAGAFLLLIFIFKRR